MRALLQCVNQANVEVEGASVGNIGRGFLIYLGVGPDDTEEQAQKLWSKIAKLRVFEDEQGKTNLSLAAVNGSVLVVSQFTLFADCKKGNRPSFTGAAAPDKAERLYRHFIELARADAQTGLLERVETGEFGAMMEVSSVNHGPFTLWLDTDRL